MYISLGERIYGFLDILERVDDPKMIKASCLSVLNPRSPGGPSQLPGLCSWFSSRSAWHAFVKVRQSLSLTDYVSYLSRSTRAMMQLIKCALSSFLLNFVWLHGTPISPGWRRSQVPVLSGRSLSFRWALWEMQNPGLHRLPRDLHFNKILRWPVSLGKAEKHRVRAPIVCGEVRYG